MALYDTDGNFLGVQSQGSGGLYDENGNFVSQKEEPKKNLLQKVGGFLKNRLDQAGITGSLVSKDENGKLKLDQEQANKMIAMGTGIGVESGATKPAVEIAKKGIPIAEKLVNKALGVTSKTIEAGRSPAKQFLQEGIVGTAEGIRSKTQKIINEVKPQIAQYLKNKTETTSIKPEIDNIIKRLEQQGSKFKPSEITQIIKRNSPESRDLIDKGMQGTLSYTEKDQLRSNLAGLIGDSGFINGVKSFEKKVVKNMASSLRNTIRTEVPETAKLFDREAAAIQANKAISKKIAKNAMIPFATIGGPTAIGYLTGDTKKGFAAGIALESIREGRKSPLVLSGLAQLLKKAGMIGEKATTQEIIRALQKLGVQSVSNQNQNPQNE